MAKPPSIRPLLPHETNQTLVECLNPVADDLRQLHTEFGGRIYRVWLVWIAYTADEDADGVIGEDEQLTDNQVVGAGRPRLLAEVELLPTPLVEGVGGLSKDLDVTGVTERGGVQVAQISPSFREDTLMGLLPEFRDPANPESLLDGIQFFWEIQETRSPGHLPLGTAGCEQGPADRRSHRMKFLPGKPERSPYSFEWTVSLARADGERGLEGEVEEVLPAGEEGPDQTLGPDSVYMETDIDEVLP